MISPTACVRALWAAWLLGWLLAAGSTAPVVFRQSLSSRLAHSVPIWVGAVFLFLQPHRFGILLHPLLPRSALMAWGGVVILALGLGFAGSSPQFSVKVERRVLPGFAYATWLIGCAGIRPRS